MGCVRARGRRMMVRPLWLLLFPLLLSGVLCARGQDAKDDPETFFELKIRPVLAGTCFKCHGGQKTSSGLRVDSRDALVRGGDSGPAVVPGQPDESLLVQAVR